MCAFMCFVSDGCSHVHNSSLHCPDFPSPLSSPCMLCCREELNRRLTVVLSILKGCVAYLPMWEGEPATEEGWWVGLVGGGEGLVGGVGR